MTDSINESIEDALADAGLDYSHIADEEAGAVVVWYDEGSGDPDAIVQAVERQSEATYVGDEQYPHDSVSGLMFEPANPPGIPLDVEDAASAVIEACKDAQDGDEVVIPVAAIDEVEMPERLPDDTPQQVWDHTRATIKEEVKLRGYRVD
jgi:hypothetical protein